MAARHCPYCGKPIPMEARECRYCNAELRSYTGDREAKVRTPADQLIRRGLLWTLLGGVAFYFTSERSPYEIPLTIPEIVTDWVLPVVILGGLGLAIFGVFRRILG